VGGWLTDIIVQDAGIGADDTRRYLHGAFINTRMALEISVFVFSLSLELSVEV